MTDITDLDYVMGFQDARLGYPPGMTAGSYADGYRAGQGFRRDMDDLWEQVCLDWEEAKGCLPDV